MLHFRAWNIVKIGVFQISTDQLIRPKMNCNYKPKFFHFWICVDIGTLIFSFCVVLWLSLHMDIETKSTGKFNMEIVENILNRYESLKIFALSVSVFFLIASILVVTYDLVIILPTKRTTVKKFKKILHEELVE